MEQKDKVTIDGVDYKLGNISILDSGEAYMIDNTPYLAKDCKYDHARNVYVHINNAEVIKGIIGYKDGNFIMGDFSQSLDNIIVKIKETGSKRTAINKEALTGASFLVTSSNVYVHLSKLSIDEFYKPAKISKEFKTSFDYGVGRVLEGYQSYYENTTIKISSYAKKVAKLIGDFTFGVEFETSAGLLSKNECYQNGLIPLRDGSITGLEYVTIPLSGEKGVQALFNSVLLLKDKSEVDKCCAVHYHIGNIPRTKEFIVALWIIVTLIQNDIYRYQSAYKQDNRKFKSKDYAKALPNLLGDFEKVLKDKTLDEAYDAIIYYLSMGMFGEGKQPSLDKIDVHPADPNNTQKWHIKTRYAIVNLIPLIFGNKKTVEFRYHDVSLNPDLVVNELIINSAIVQFVIKNQKDILENILKKKDVTLEKIIQCTLTDGTVMDYIFDGLNYKRDIVCKSFLTGEHFIDYKFYNFKSASTISLTTPITPKEFALDFYKKHLSNGFLDNNNPDGNVTRFTTRAWTDTVIGRGTQGVTGIRGVTFGNPGDVNNQVIDNPATASEEVLRMIVRLGSNTRLEERYNSKIQNLIGKAIGFSKSSPEDHNENAIMRFGENFTGNSWTEKRRNKYFRNFRVIPNLNMPMYHIDNTNVVHKLLDVARNVNNDVAWNRFITSINNPKLTNVAHLYRAKINNHLISLFSTTARITAQSTLNRIIDIQYVFVSMMCFNTQFCEVFDSVLDSSMFIAKDDDQVRKVNNLKLTRLNNFQFDDSTLDSYMPVRLKLSKTINGRNVGDYTIANADLNLQGYIYRVVLERISQEIMNDVWFSFDSMFARHLLHFPVISEHLNRTLVDENGRNIGIMPAITSFNNIQKVTSSMSLGSLFRHSLIEYSREGFTPTSLNLIFN